MRDAAVARRRFASTRGASAQSFGFASALALASLHAVTSAACATPGPEWVRVVDTSRELGTSYEVVLVVRRGEEAGAREALARAREHCRALEAGLSEWRDDSEISRVNAHAYQLPQPLSRDLAGILHGSAEVHRVTGGAFDPTWRALAPLWDRAAVRDRRPSAAEIDSARAGVGWRHVRLDSTSIAFTHADVRLGIAGVAKGWIIDSLFHLLRGAGYAHILVNIGGDLRVIGHDVDGREQVFSILDPFTPDRVALELPLGDGAMATSGVSFRRRLIGGVPVGHILDPRSGAPPAFDGSVTVLTRDAAMADALATGLFVLGPLEGLALARELPGVEAIYLTRDGVRATIETAPPRPTGAPPR